MSENVVPAPASHPVIVVDPFFMRPNVQTGPAMPQTAPIPVVSAGNTQPASPNSNAAAAAVSQAPKGQVAAPAQGRANPNVTAQAKRPSALRGIVQRERDRREQLSRAGEDIYAARLRRRTASATSPNTTSKRSNGVPANLSLPLAPLIPVVWPTKPNTPASTSVPARVPVLSRINASPNSQPITGPTTHESKAQQARTAIRRVASMAVTSATGAATALMARIKEPTPITPGTVAPAVMPNLPALGQAPVAPKPPANATSKTLRDRFNGAKDRAAMLTTASSLKINEASRKGMDWLNDPERGKRNKTIAFLAGAAGAVALTLAIKGGLELNEHLQGISDAVDSSAGAADLTTPDLTTPGLTELTPPSDEPKVALGLVDAATTDTIDIATPDTPNISIPEIPDTIPTLKLEAGGSIWESIEASLAKYDLPTDDHTVDMIKDAVLQAEGLTEGSAEQLPVGYSFTVPEEILQKLADAQ